MTTPRSTSPDAGTNPRARTRGARWVLLLTSTIVSLVCADVLFRWFGPRPYAAPVLTDRSGHQVSLYQIVQALHAEPIRQHDGPRGPGPAAGSSGAPFTVTYDRPRWDYFDATGSITFDFNSLGFRDREFSAAKPPGEYRVLAIGDSFTFGLGVRLEDSWPQQLERELAAVRGTPVEVINAGFTNRSATTEDFAPWVESDGIALQPDVVVLGFCLNDMHPNLPMLGYLVPRPEPPLFGWSAILKHVQAMAAQRVAKARPYDASEILRTRGDIHWVKSQTAMREMQRHLSDAGIRFVVVIQPMITRLGDDYPYVRLHDMVREFCAGAGIECLDLLPRFLGREAEDLWVHATDQHPNHEGQRIIAHGILEYLTKR
jgi:GDSL-like Lipase/Acylhydrolase family